MRRNVVLVSRIANAEFQDSGLSFNNHRCIVSEERAIELKNNHPLWNREFGLDKSFKIKAHSLKPIVVRASTSDTAVDVANTGPELYAVHGIQASVDLKAEREFFGEQTPQKEAKGSQPGITDFIPSKKTPDKTPGLPPGAPRPGGVTQ